MSKPAQRAPIKKAGKLTVREFLWSKLREFKSLTSNDVLDNLTGDERKQYNLRQDKFRYYMEPWVKADYVSAELKADPKAGVRKVKTYTLVKDTGVNPPRVDAKGKPITQGLGREQMWRTMKITARFTHLQLAHLASTDDIVIAPSEAKSYVEYLCKAGYLKRVKKANNRGGLAEYQMKPAAWTGSKPPMIKRMHVVFDQNTHQVVWPKDGDIESEY